MIGTKMVIAGVLAFAASFGLIASMAPAVPDDLTDPRMAAAHAAECAGFPPHIVLLIKKYYKPDGEVQLENLPPSYEVKKVQLHVTYGGCRSEEVGPFPTTSLLMLRASAFVDRDDTTPGSLPFYVIARVGGSGADPIFAAIRLPSPEIAVAPALTPSGTAT